MISYVFEYGKPLFTIFVLHRPPSSKLSDFLTEFDEFLENSCMLHNRVILGDFNFRFDDTTNSHVKRLVTLLEQYDMRQHVTDRTNSDGHVADLIVTRGSDDLFESISVHDCGISDHHSVNCHLNISRISNSVDCSYDCRWKLVDFEMFFSNFLVSPVCNLNVVFFRRLTRLLRCKIAFYLLLLIVTDLSWL